MMTVLSREINEDDEPQYNRRGIQNMPIYA